jgi:hypothetical protein
MALGDARSILEQLAAGELTPEEAEAALDATTAAADEPRAPSRGDGTSERDGDRDREHVPIELTVSGGGRIEIQGEDVDLPSIDGPGRCVIVEHDDRAEVNAQVGDDALLLVPADADPASG